MRSRNRCAKWVFRPNKILAFDAGPGNAPVDDWADRHTGKPIDENGALAWRGHVDDRVLMDMPGSRFLRTPQKSLDRMDFTADAVEHLSPEDGGRRTDSFHCCFDRARERTIP